MNYFCTCFISWMIDMFCSTSCSCERRTCETKLIFQFSMSVFLFVALINCYCIAKFPTCYFFKVSTRSLMPVSQSCDLTMVTSSPSIIFSNSESCLRVPSTVDILLKGAILFSVCCFYCSRSGRKTISVLTSKS